MGIVTSADCVIFAAGDEVDTAIVRSYIQPDTFIITADAGYSACTRCGFSPNLLVGDFDSQAAPKTDTPTITLNPIKDDTDTADALQQAIQRGFRHIVLFGATGGRLDHTYANLDLCALAAGQGAELLIVDNHHKIFALKEETVTIDGDKSKFVSVFAVGGPCVLSLEGFFYLLKDYNLMPFCGLGVSNETVEEKATISIKQGTALIFITDKDF